MEVNRLSRGDYAVLAGFVVGIIGVSLTWYAEVDHYTQGTLRYGVHGWAYTLGWLSWVCLLAAALAVVVGSGVVSQFRVDLGSKAPLVVLGLGGVATVLVLFGFATKPSADSLGLYLAMHLNAGMLAKMQASGDWSNEVTTSGFGAGIVLSLIAGAAVTLGGYLKLRDAGMPLFAATAPATAAAPVAAAPSPAPQVAASEAATAPAAASPVRFCGQCGAQFAEDGAKFCARCGAPRPAIGDTEATQ